MEIPRQSKRKVHNISLNYFVIKHYLSSPVQQHSGPEGDGQAAQRDGAPARGGGGEGGEGGGEADGEAPP